MRLIGQGPPGASSGMDIETPFLSPRVDKCALVTLDLHHADGPRLCVRGIFGMNDHHSWPHP